MRNPAAHRSAARPKPYPNFSLGVVQPIYVFKHDAARRIAPEHVVIGGLARSSRSRMLHTFCKAGVLQGGQRVNPLNQTRSSISTQPEHTLVVMGPGYCGAALARAAAAAGFAVVAVSRAPEQSALPAEIEIMPFDRADKAIASATHLISTVPPGPAGDPVLARYAEAITAAPNLHWLGYLSSTSVYGDRGGATVDEETPPQPSSERGKNRLAAEQAWRAIAHGRPLDIFRAAGIYGPGRSAFDQLRSGAARRIIAPGHVFSRIHRDDIVAAVLAAMRSPARPPGGRTRVFNLADLEPAESATVLEEAARLMGVPPPPAISLADALPAMSEMGQSFWRELRHISSTWTRITLGITWRYPDFRAGLTAILAEEIRRANP